MKKNFTTICVGLMIMIFSAGLALAGNGQQKASGSKCGGNGSCVESMPYEQLSEAEIKAMIFMVEEEKVARDVYNLLYKTWGIPAFANIAKAEQRHMNAIISLLNKYELKNPVAGLEPGEFTNLQELYDSLVKTGKKGEIEALHVGATIEDLDIYDLLRELDSVDNEDITVVFNNLLNGSENHLRSFCALLVLYGSSPYEEQGYLTQGQIDDILNTPRTRGKGNRKNRLPQNKLLFDSNCDGTCDRIQQ